MKLMVTLEDFDRLPCDRYADLPTDEEFDAIAEIECRNPDHDDVIDDILWLIAYCKKAQTDEMIEYLEGHEIGVCDKVALAGRCMWYARKLPTDYLIVAEVSFDRLVSLLIDDGREVTDSVLDYLIRWAFPADKLNHWYRRQLLDVSELKRYNELLTKVIERKKNEINNKL
jgi:hypothetical protein